MSLQRKNKMHMIDVMSKLKEIAESGYDNEDIQRGIDAAATHVFAEDETMEGAITDKVRDLGNKLTGGFIDSTAQQAAQDKKASRKVDKPGAAKVGKPKAGASAPKAGASATVAKYEDTTTESDENDILEDADIEEVHEAVEEDHDELADILKLAGKSGVIGMAKPQTIIAEDIELEEEEIEETDYDTTANEDSAEAETAISEEEIEEVLDTELEEEAVEETVEVPVTALADLMRLAGYSDYQEQVEEYANEPTEEYMDAEEQLIGLSGGMNGPKKAYAAAAGGDNAMAQEPREIEESDVDLETTFESFYKKYDAFVEDLKSE
jgi:hypothetical protein